MPTKNAKEHVHLTDKPAEEDLLSINKNIKGLSQFLIESSTPMTISIQGEWGAGKSSIMKQVEKEIGDSEKSKVSIIWFDTWQFSQFAFDDQLPIILLNRLVSKITEESDFVNAQNNTVEKIKKMIEEIGKPLVRTGKVGINAFTENNFNISIFGNSKKNSTEKIYESIEKLKSSFEDLVNNSNKDKFVIFIDDLDRLEPKKAVELLEVLKIFLDVEKCVFVLAIDHEIVIRGVADKYNFDMNDPDEFKKGASFFDKIIQVPYSVPMADYNIQKIIQELLPTEFSEESPIKMKDYEELIISSIGRNPRSIKRVINMFKLNRLIKEADEDKAQKDADESILLFMFTCMQNSYVEIYSYVLNNKDSFEKGIENLLAKEIEEDYPNKTELEDELAQVESEDFLNKIEAILNQLGGNKEEILRKVASYSKTTFIGDQKNKSAVETFASIRELLDFHARKTGTKNKYAVQDIEDLENKITSLSEAIDTKYVGNKNLTRVDFRLNGSIFTTIHIRKNTLSAECLVGHELKDNEEILDVLEKYDKTLTQKSNVTFNLEKLDMLENKKNMEDLLKVISIIVENRE